MDFRNADKNSTEPGWRVTAYARTRWTSALLGGPARGSQPRCVPAPAPRPWVPELDWCAQCRGSNEQALSVPEPLRDRERETSRVTRVFPGAEAERRPDVPPTKPPPQLRAGVAPHGNTRVRPRTRLPKFAG